MSYKRRVEMEGPMPIGMPGKVIVDGLRVPATQVGFRLLKEAIQQDREHGLEPPEGLEDLTR